MEYLLIGFLTSLSLILAIGAQNIFVIEQGLKKQHIFEDESRLGSGGFKAILRISCLYTSYLNRTAAGSLLTVVIEALRWNSLCWFMKNPL